VLVKNWLGDSGTSTDPETAFNFDFSLTMFLYAYIEGTVKFQSALCVYFSFYFYSVLETSYGSKIQYCRSVCICWPTFPYHRSVWQL